MLILLEFLEKISGDSEFRKGFRNVSRNICNFYLHPFVRKFHPVITPSLVIRDHPFLDGQLSFPPKDTLYEGNLIDKFGKPAFLAKLAALEFFTLAFNLENAPHPPQTRQKSN